MKKLTAEKWGKFGINGVLFEELARDLLELEYPGKSFYLTKHSHDGSKDAVCEIPLLEQTKAEIWMECKYHKKALEVKEVAMTLVMAMLDNAQQIVFFSYSKVNRGFDKYIARYKKELKKEVILYDDEALEDLIIKHWDKEKIRNYFLNASMPIHRLEESDIIISYEIKNLKKRNFYYLNEVVTLQIYLTNRNIDKNYFVDICLDMSDTDFFRIVSHKLKKNNGCHHLKLFHNTSDCYEISLQLISYKERIKLPEIVVKYNEERIRLPRKHIESRWIAETRLIGQSFYDIKSESLKLLQSHNSLGVIHIYGSSGTGKSRLLQEIFTFSDYKVLSFDMERQTIFFNEFIRKLISFLTGFPLFRRTVTLVGDETPFPEEKRYGAHVLYSPSFDFLKEKSKLISYTQMLLEQENYLLVIDNAQRCDVETLDFLDKLTIFAESKTNASFLLFSFNTDQVFPESPAYALNEKLKILSEKDPRNYLSHIVEGFEYKDACHFINECICWPDKEKLDLQETIKLIVDHCGTRPFFIQNVLLYMVQKGILRRTTTTAYYIANIPQFHKSIRSVPENLNALLKKREELLVDHFKATGQIKSYQRFMWLLSALQPFPYILFRTLIKDVSLLKELEELNLIQEDEKGYIHFRHQLIGLYFQKMYPVRWLPSEVVSETIQAITDRKLERKLNFFYFQLCYLDGSLTLQTIKDTFQEVAKYRIEPAFIELWIETILELLSDYASNLNSSDVAKALCHSCLFIAHHTGLKNGLKYYQKTSTFVLDNAAYFVGQSEKIYPLFKGYENARLNTGNHTGVEDFSRQVERFLKKIESDPLKLSKYLGKEKIQQCIILNALNQPKAALLAIAEALKIAENTNDLKLKMSALREQGYVYYYREDAALYRKELSDAWQECFEVFQRDYFPKLGQKQIDYKDQPTVAAYLVGLLGDLANFNYSKADEKANVIEKMIDKTGMPFYEIKLRLALSVYFLIKDSNDSQWNYYGIQEKLIHQATDRCIAYFSMRDYPICFYLLGIVQLYSAKNAYAFDNLQKAFLLAQHYSTNQQIEKGWSYLFYDIAYYFNDSKQRLSSECLSKIKNQTIADEVNKILALTETTPPLDTHPIYTALTDKNHRLNIPKV